MVTAFLSLCILLHSVVTILLCILITARHPKDDGRLYFQSVHISGGGVPGPSLRSRGGGPRSQIFQGAGPRSQIFQGGGPRSQIFGGVPGLRFSAGVLVSVKGKNFNTRFGLIHVQTGKKNFCRGDPPPSKGKNF